MTSPHDYYLELHKHNGLNFKRTSEEVSKFRSDFFQALANKYGVEPPENFSAQMNDSNPNVSSRDGQLAGYVRLLRSTWTKQPPDWDKIQFGLLLTYRLEPLVIDVPDGGQLVIMDETVFTLIYLLAKAVCNYMLILEDKTSARILEIAEIDKTLDESTGGIGRFTEAMIAFCVWKYASLARPYLVEQQVMIYSGWLTDAVIMRLLTEATFLAMMGNQDRPKPSSGMFSKLFNRNPSQQTSDKPPATAAAEYKLTDNKNVTQRCFVSKEPALATSAIASTIAISALQGQQDWTACLAGYELLHGMMKIFDEINGLSAEEQQNNYDQIKSVSLLQVPAEAREQVTPLMDTVKALMEALWGRSRQTFYRFSEQPRSPRSN